MLTQLPGNKFDFLVDFSHHLRVTPLVFGSVVISTSPGTDANAAAAATAASSPPTSTSTEGVRWPGTVETTARAKWAGFAIHASAGITSTLRVDSSVIGEPAVFDSPSVPPSLLDVDPDRRGICWATMLTVRDPKRCRLARYFCKNLMTAYPT